MSAFDDITLSFDGANYTIAADRVWELLYQLEPVMGYDFLIQKLAVNDPPKMRIYKSFAIALRFGGHKTVTPELVQERFRKIDVYETAFILAGILRLGEPPDDMQSVGGQQPTDEEAQDVKKKD